MRSPRTPREPHTSSIGAGNPVPSWPAIQRSAVVRNITAMYNQWRFGRTTMAENTATAPASQPVAGPKDGILGMLSVFIDPAATARRVTMRWFWVYPFVVMSAALILLQIVATPYRTRATELMLQEQGITGQAAQERLAMMAKFAPVGWVVTPIITLVIIALSAWLVSVAASIIDAGVRYAYLFSLASVMGMFYVLQTVAGILVLRSKSVDDITSMKDLQAPFGLDI